MSITVLKNETHIARKEHRCMLCGSIISVGTRYNSQTNVYDGKIEQFRSHIECLEIAGSLMQNYSEYDANDFDNCIADYIYDHRLKEKGILTNQRGYDLVKVVLAHIKGKTASEK